MDPSKYVGLSYGDLNCAALCKLVWEEEYDLSIDFSPKETMTGHMKDLYWFTSEFQKTEKPIEGDIAVMSCKYPMSHVGIYLKNKTILHSFKLANQVIISKISSLNLLGLKIHSFYGKRSLYTNKT